jgi:hypothetical protein
LDNYFKINEIKTKDTIDMNSSSSSSSSSNNNNNNNKNKLKEISLLLIFEREREKRINLFHTRAFCAELTQNDLSVSKQFKKN